MEISWRVTGLSKKEELYVAHVVAVLASAAARILESKQSMCIRFLPALEKNHLEFLYYVGLREDKVHDGLGRGVFECPIGWKTEEIVQLITYRLKTALVAIPNLGSVSDTQGRSRINTAHYITITVILPITNPES